MKNQIAIPVALQLVVDDVGWHNGADERHLGKPSRSGLPRMHHPLDYEELNAIGKGLNMKIVCSLVLGEWDKDNLLRGVPHVTYDQEGWDRASEIDMEYAGRCLEALEGGEYLDYALHGLLHEYYDHDVRIIGSQYYPYRYDEEKQCYTSERTHIPEEEFERQVQLFLEIYRSWGFQKEISTFVSTAGTIGTYEENRGFAEVLKKYGIHYWSNSWGAETEKVSVQEGIICVKEFGIMPWNAYDVDPAYLAIKGEDGQPLPGCGYGAHLTNFIRYNPEKNTELVSAWVDYFNRQAEVFGVMLARDNAFSASQALYHRFAGIQETEDGYEIDLTEVDKQGATGLRQELYISLKNGIVPTGCIGGQITEYETRKAFKIYQIRRDGSSTVKIIAGGKEDAV